MIEFGEVSFAYGGNIVLRNLSVTLQTGSFHFLTGPSGAGKSTFLRLCTASLMPNSGFVQLFGRDTRGLTRDEVAALRQRLGVVDQSTQFVDHLTIAENILLPVQISHRSQTATRDDLQDLMDWVEISDIADALPSQVSGGELARASLARAVITAPDIILADEPTGNVDADMAERLVQLMVQLNRMGKTFVIATHDLSLVRLVKSQVETRILRIKNKTLDLGAMPL